MCLSHHACVHTEELELVVPAEPLCSHVDSYGPVELSSQAYMNRRCGRPVAAPRKETERTDCHQRSPSSLYSVVVVNHLGVYHHDKFELSDFRTRQELDTC